ncbi:MAG TPA: DinB family protein [Dehalococcoidia bacterium]
MDDRTFADWVAPIAEALGRDRTTVIAFAASVPDREWARPSGAEGWTCKDILAHLAGGNDQLVQILLRAVTSRQAPERSALDPDTDAENARGVERRRDWPVDRLIADLQSENDEIQELLSQLTDADEEARVPGFSMTLGDFLRLVQHERHDAEHLVQMQTAVG